MPKAKTEIDFSWLPKDVNPSLIKQVWQSLTAAKAQGTAHTKTRGEVSGGGRKPWRQKGTGRARAGSIRSPLWVGGGVVFGPRSKRSLKLSLPQSFKRQALAQALSIKLKANELMLVKSITFSSAKTKEALKFLTELDLAQKKVLILKAKVDPASWLAVRNLANCQILRADEVNSAQLLASQAILVEDAALPILKARTQR